MNQVSRSKAQVGTQLSGWAWLLGAALLLALVAYIGKSWVLQGIPNPPAKGSFASLVRQNQELDLQTCYVCGAGLPARTPSVRLPTKPSGALHARVWICDQCPNDTASHETALRRFQEVIIAEPANSEDNRRLARQLVLAR